MALIVCIECGKKYSDRAPACPECACPTSVNLGGAAPASVPVPAAPAPAVDERAIEAMCEMATKDMLAAVERARATGDRASREFDRAADHVQRLASRSIDLFGGDAPSRAVEIAAASKKACDELYATYQMLVAELDAECRPMLDRGAKTAAIKAVSDAIEYFNDESEIENNFSASLNGQSRGEFASRKYTPSIDNRVIQKFWERAAAAGGKTPTAHLPAGSVPAYDPSADLRRMEEEQRKAEEEAKREAEDEKLRLENAGKGEKLVAAVAEIGKKAASEAKARQEAYEAELVEWEKGEREIKDKRAREVMSLVGVEEIRLKKEAQETKKKAEEFLTGEIARAEAEIARLEGEYAAIGALKLGEKRAKRAEIAAAAAELEGHNNSLRMLGAEYSATVMGIAAKVKALRTKLEAEMEAKYPSAERPEVPDAENAQGEYDGVFPIFSAMARYGGGTNAPGLKSQYKLAPADTYIDAVMRALAGKGLVAPVPGKNQSVFVGYDRTPEEIYAILCEIKPDTRTAVQIANDGIKDAILEFMSDGKIYTVFDIQSGCPVVQDLTNQRVSALVRQLVTEDRVERIEIERKAYFKIAASAPKAAPKSAPAKPAAAAPVSAVQIANESVKDAMCEFMSDGGYYTITDIAERCTAAQDLSNQRISALMRQLVADGRVERTEDGVRAYFHVVD